MDNKEYINKGIFSKELGKKLAKQDFIEKKVIM